MTFVEATVAVSRTMSAEGLARVQEDACTRVAEAVPNADVTVNAIPRALT